MEDEATVDLFGRRVVDPAVLPGAQGRQRQPGGAALELAYLLPLEFGQPAEQPGRFLLAEFAEELGELAAAQDCLALDGEGVGIAFGEAA
ncbi:MAG TPA: hypothetical protein PKC23_13090 [Candidatus Desulfobacillus sp.]|nr:hypothetical protein [Candidatus Desulfobacillus sp.]